MAGGPEGWEISPDEGARGGLGGFRLDLTRAKPPMSDLLQGHSPDGFLVCGPCMRSWGPWRCGRMHEIFEGDSCFVHGQVFNAVTKPVETEPCINRVPTGDVVQHCSINRVRQLTEMHGVDETMSTLNRVGDYKTITGVLPNDPKCTCWAISEDVVPLGTWRAVRSIPAIGCARQPLRIRTSAIAGTTTRATMGTRIGPVPALHSVGHQVGTPVAAAHGSTSRQRREHHVPTASALRVATRSQRSATLSADGQALR